MTELTDEQFVQAMRFCRTIGATHGRGAAEWSAQYFPGGGRDTGGNLGERARRALVALENGEVETPSPLSGEYAGDYALRDLLVGIADELRVSTDSLQLDADEFGNEYEDSYRCAWETACQEILWATIQAAVETPQTYE